MRLAPLLMLAIAGCCGTAVAADDPDVWPNPGTMAVPNLSFKSGTAGDDEKYFYFHREAVSFEKARSEIEECAAYSADMALNAADPNYIQFGGDPEHLEGTFISRAYRSRGLVGRIIGGVVNDAVLSGVARENTRACMAFKGYSRYGITTVLWNALNTGTPAEVVTRLAVIASGPKPQTEVLVP